MVDPIFSYVFCHRVPPAVRGHQCSESSLSQTGSQTLNIEYNNIFLLFLELNNIILSIPNQKNTCCWLFFNFTFKEDSTVNNGTFIQRNSCEQREKIRSHAIPLFKGFTVIVNGNKLRNCELLHCYLFCFSSKKILFYIVI